MFFAAITQYAGFYIKKVYFEMKVQLETGFSYFSYPKYGKDEGEAILGPRIFLSFSLGGVKVLNDPVYGIFHYAATTNYPI